MVLVLPGPWEQREEQRLPCHGEVLLLAAKEESNV